jgi:hypothetical protein
VVENLKNDQTGGINGVNNHTNEEIYKSAMGQLPVPEPSVQMGGKKDNKKSKKDKKNKDDMMGGFAQLSTILSGLSKL